MSDDKVFVSGVYPRKRSENAPEWLIGGFGVNVEQLGAWLVEHADKADARGFLNIAMKVGKSGKAYAEIDTWKPEQSNTPADNGEDLPF